MPHDKPARFARHLLRDTVIALACLLAIIFAAERVAGPSSQLQFSELFASTAHAGELARPVAERNAQLILPKAMTSTDPVVATGSRPQPAVLGLAAVFSLLVAFNLAFFRHLRRVYASPRRGGWRRG